MKNKKRVTGLMILLFSLLMLASSASAENTNSAYWTDALTGERLDQLTLMTGEARVIRLNAEVPAGRTLKAYSFRMAYDSAVLATENTKASSDSAFPPMNIDASVAGKTGVNSFDTEGLEGPATFTVVDVNIKGLASGKTDISVSFSAYGTAADDEFQPRILPLQVNVN